MSVRTLHCVVRKPRSSLLLPPDGISILDSVGLLCSLGAETDFAEYVQVVEKLITQVRCSAFKVFHCASGHCFAGFNWRMVGYTQGDHFSIWVVARFVDAGTDEAALSFANWCKFSFNLNFWIDAVSWIKWDWIFVAIFSVVFFRSAIQGNVVGKMKERGSQPKVLFVVYTNSLPVVNGLVERQAHREETTTIWRQHRA